jgi:transposase
MAVGFNFRRPVSDQDFLLPPDVRDWLPPRHLAWAVLERVGSLDLSAFTSAYRCDGQGRPAYDPRMMVTLLLYCYCKGVRSSRAVEMACYDDVGARVITGNMHVDHATAARFVKRHADPLTRLFVQVLAVCAKDGLVRVDLVAGDGTKVRASASKSANATLEQLDMTIAELEEALAGQAAAWVAQAAAEDPLPGLGADDIGPPAPAGPPAPPTPAGRRAADRLRRAKEAKGLLAERHGDTAAARTPLRRAADRAQRAGQRLERALADQQAKVERHEDRPRAGAGKGAPGRPPLPVEQAPAVRAAVAKAEDALRRTRADGSRDALPKANTTDPRSRVQPAKAGGYLQGYNVQALANTAQVILAITRHDNPIDVGACHPLLRLARANLDAAGAPGPIGKALFDAGYASTDNFTTATEADLYVAVHHEAAQTGRGPATAKTIPAGWADMAARMGQDEAKKTYKQRCAIIEPVWAQLFERLGRHLNYRGPMVDVELSLWGTSHNLLKHIRHTAKTATAAAGTAPLTA